MNGLARALGALVVSAALSIVPAAAGAVTILPNGVAVIGQDDLVPQGGDQYGLTAPVTSFFLSFNRPQTPGEYYRFESLLFSIASSADISLGYEDVPNPQTYSLTGGVQYDLLDLFQTTGTTYFGHRAIFISRSDFGPAAITFLGASLTRVSAVPEPAVWAVMIAGFGLVGSEIRRRRRKVALAYSWSYS